MTITNYTSKAQNNESTKTCDFKYMTEQFGDIRILRYQIPGWETLTPKQKELLYYLYEAALSGRDIIYDQNYKNNLLIRRTLEYIVENYKGDRTTEDWNRFMTYCKRVWVSNGVHHHYSMDKIMPEFTKDYFKEIYFAVYPNNNNGVLQEDYYTLLEEQIFSTGVAPKRVTLDSKHDMVKNSACNFYDEDVTQAEVDEYYKKLSKPNDHTPLSYGLNSKVVKEDGVVTEKVWKVGGMYTEAIEKIVYWLEKAVPVSETPEQKAALLKLIEFYKTGALKTFDEYCILWLKDINSRIDVVNGFIEVYGDPLGRKGAFQSMVSIRDLEATKRAKAISDQAQWFENNMPFAPEFKKEKVKGVVAKVIDVVIESGDCSPTTPIGVNLPNADWIRRDYGSKSVSIGNIVEAYDESSKNSGAIEEFAFSAEEIALAKKYASVAGKVHTDLHEIIGHGSGQLKKGVADPSETLKNYASTLEESRADLIALYYIIDPKMVELGFDLEMAKAEYNSYIRNGLMTQLVRLELGKDLEESHMRNRHLIAQWVYEKGKADNVIEFIKRDGKTYVVINDYAKLRKLFGELLTEVQRIKSEGDYEAGKALVENYGVKVDAELHKEIKTRWEKLGIAPYAAFINPELVPVYKDGKLIDVKVNYPEDFTKQMLDYGKKYGFLK